MPDKTDIEQVDRAQLPAPVAAFVDKVLVRIESTDSDQMSLDIAARILSGERVEDVLGGQEAAHAKDIIGMPVTIHGVRWIATDMGGLGFYALVSCSDAFRTEPYPVTCGSVNIMAQLYRLEEIGALPLDCVFTESPKPTASGFRPMWLAAKPK